MASISRFLGPESSPCWDVSLIIFGFLEQGDSCQLRLASRGLAQTARELPWPHATPARDVRAWRRALPRAAAFRSALRLQDFLTDPELRLLKDVADVDLGYIRGVTDVSFAPLARAARLRVTGTEYLSQAALRHLGGVRSLTLRSSQVTDAVLAHLPPGLTHLDIGIEFDALRRRQNVNSQAGAPSVTDWGVERLPASVVSLGLSGHAVTDAGLRFLGRVRALDISWTRVQGGGLAHLSSCRALRLCGMALGAGHAAGLAAMPALRALDASCASFEAPDFCLPQLTHLNVSGAAGVGAVLPNAAAGQKKLSGLRELRLSRTQLAPIRRIALAPQAVIAALAALAPQAPQAPQAAQAQDVESAFAALAVRRVDVSRCAWITLPALLRLRDVEVLDCADSNIRNSDLGKLAELPCGVPSPIKWEISAAFQHFN